MLVGVPREMKNHEHRVAITPAGVMELVHRGHEVLLEAGAGAGSSLPDTDYVAAGAKLVPDVDELWGMAELVLKVKEPVPEEYPRLRRDQILFTYPHLAGIPGALDDPALAAGVNVAGGEVVLAEVAQAHGMPLGGAH